MVDNFDLICEWLDNQRIADELDGTWYGEFQKMATDTKGLILSV